VVPSALRVAALAGVLGAAVWLVVAQGDELADAGRRLSHLAPGWLVVAMGFEAASMVVFARLQRRLLRAGGVRVGLPTMVGITLAGNAVASTFPGGVALGAVWVFDQLRRRGVDRFLRVWVFLVAGALSSFALFVVLAAGVELAGGRGPLAGTRWIVATLAAVAAGAAALGATVRDGRARRVALGTGRWMHRHVPGARFVAGTVLSLRRRIRTVRLGRRDWTVVFGLALLNWLYDCATLVASMRAVHVAVPWRDILAVYALTQVAGALPITPGGLGVVEGSLGSLLLGYGIATAPAVAVVLLYRVLTFWGLVPLGWLAWLAVGWTSQRPTGTVVAPAPPDA